MLEAIVNTNKRELSSSEFHILQDILNAKAHESGKHRWRNARTEEDFALGASLELAEFTESFNWKWWKKAGEIDLWNAKIEAIDMVHFLVSASMLSDKNDSNKDFTDCPCVDNITFRKGYRDNLLESDFHVRQISFQILKKITKGEYVKALTQIFDFLQMRNEEVSAIYMAKYTLNEFRWKSGYGDTYKKVSESGIEDNQLLEGVVDKFLKDDSVMLSEIPNLVLKVVEEFQK